jgi:LAO/AO transport system kinase
MTVRMPELAERVMAGEVRALARAATVIENHWNGHAELVRQFSLHTGHAWILGITGPPGVGKSTLCDKIIQQLRMQDKTVAVIAVDPSSPVTGGAVLGDRVRMQQHHADAGVFIRSMATRGIAGGVARATADLITLFDAAGRDVVIIETTGVGQAEVEIARLAQVTMLVLAPGSGDDVQAMKAGVMEVADLFVINKADLPGAEKLQQELLAAVDERPIVLTVAASGDGIAQALAAARACAPHRSPAKPPLEAWETTIDHLGIAVRSIDDALKFYEAQLGLHVTLRETVVQEEVNVAILPVGESRIELLEAASADSTIGKFIAQRGGGIHHVALRVSSLQAVVEKLKAGGARILNEPRTGAGGHLYVFVHPASGGGVLLELIQA